jgi:thioredoxin-related protein
MQKRRIILNWIILAACVMVAAFTFLRAVPKFERPKTPYVLYYYYQAGCPACTKIKPVIGELKKRYTGCVTVKRRNLAWVRGHGVQAVPTIVLENRDGEEIRRWIGAQSLRAFVQVIEPLCPTK